ncbi:hypothetical protein [Pararhizobium sp.]|uniref:hypothetical protein n=1 Tax=Pararhizobium sp. TaxID=1977563 RepID=UPI003D0E564D
MTPICGPEDLPLRPELFEALYRAAAKRMDIPSFCRVRHCGRQEECAGKLKLREIPSVFRGLVDVDALLPMCIAGADDVWFCEFDLHWILCREVISAAFGHPKRFAACLPLTSNGQFPSISRSKTKRPLPHVPAR